MNYNKHHAGIGVSYFYCNFDVAYDPMHTMKHIIIHLENIVTGNYHRNHLALLPKDDILRSFGQHK
jgi:hypothetical protein